MVIGYKSWLSLNITNLMSDKVNRHTITRHTMYLLSFIHIMVENVFYRRKMLHRKMINATKLISCYDAIIIISIWRKVVVEWLLVIRINRCLPVVSPLIPTRPLSLWSIPIEIVSWWICWTGIKWWTRGKGASIIILTCTKRKLKLIKKV